MQLTSLFSGVVSPGSACLIAAVPEEWIQSIPEKDPVTGTITDDIILTDDHKWLRVALVSKTRPYKEETLRESPGLSWPQVISGRSAGHSGALHLTFEEWANHRWVLLYHEVGTSATYLVGKPGSGATFNLQYSNDKATISQVSFNRQAVERAPLYEGSYTLDNDVVIVNPGDSIQRIPVLGSIFYRVTTEATTITFPQLQGREILMISRGGIKDLEVITDPDIELTLDNECYFNQATGELSVPEYWPLNPNETLFILFQ